MSFTKSLNASIRSCIEKYVSEISTVYNLDKNDLMKLWDGESVKPETKQQDKDLLKLSKKELLDLCKIKGIKCSASKSKPDIISCLNDGTNTSIKSVFKPVSKPTDNIIKKLEVARPEILIKKNDFGNMEHFETHFVFDSKTRKVIGKQGEDGKIIDISKDDINTCNKYKFEYTIPENLNTGEEDDGDLELNQSTKVDEDEYEEIEEEVDEDEEEIEIELDDE